MSGVRGSVSYFPSEAFAQAAAMFDESSRGVQAFALWWAGKPIAQDARDVLVAAATLVLREIDRVRVAEPTVVLGVNDPDDPDDPAFDAADNYVSLHQAKPIRGHLSSTIYRNLGRSKSDFASVIVVILTIALGGHPFVDEPSSIDDEPSLRVLLLKSFGGDDFPSPQNSAAPHPLGSEERRAANKHQEAELSTFLAAASILSEREALSSFVLSLGDEEIEAARKYAHMFYEDLPVIYEANELLYGRNTFARTLRTLAKQASIGVKAFGTIAVAWLLREVGRERFDLILKPCNLALPGARALCTLARTFPKYRELLLAKNAARLAALPEETKSKMFDSIKDLVTT